MSHSPKFVHCQNHHQNHYHQYNKIIRIEYLPAEEAAGIIGDLYDTLSDTAEENITYHLPSSQVSRAFRTLSDTSARVRRFRSTTAGSVFMDGAGVETSGGLLEEYNENGIVTVKNDYYYQNTRIRILMDLRPDGSFENFDYNDRGTVDLRLVRDG